MRKAKPGPSLGPWKGAIACLNGAARDGLVGSECINLRSICSFLADIVSACTEFLIDDFVKGSRVPKMDPSNCPFGIPSLRSFLIPLASNGRDAGCKDPVMEGAREL